MNLSDDNFKPSWHLASHIMATSEGIGGKRKESPMWKFWATVLVVWALLFFGWRMLT